MILLLDAGNSRMKWYLLDQAEIIQNDSISLEGWELVVNQLIHQYPVQVIGASSVSVDLSYLYQLKNIHVFIPNAGSKLPFVNLYETPETLGTDRLAGLSGAMQLSEGEPVLKIDTGTCLTFDLCDGKNFLGGRISPGVHMRLKAMHQFTSKLPQPGFEKETGGLAGRNTEDCLRHGALLGAVNEIEAYVHHLKRTFSNLHVILTGGDGPVLIKHLEKSIFVTQITLREHLVAEGLVTLLALNVQNDI